MSSDLPIAADLEVISEQVAALSPPAAAGPQPRSMLYLVSALVGGNVAGKLLRMAGGILQARFVDPSVLGLFNGVGLVLGYAPFLQLGILNGLNRELPYFVGKGDRKRVMELAAAAQAWALAVGGLVGVSLLGVAVWQLLRGNLWMAAGWATNALMAVSLFYNTYYLQMTYRTAHDFARLAMAGVVENAVALVAVVLVAVLSFYGLCLRALLAAAVSTAILLLLATGPRRPGLELPTTRPPAPDRLSDLRRGADLRVVDGARFDAGAEVCRPKGTRALCPGSHGRHHARNAADGRFPGNLPADGGAIRPHRQVGRVDPHVAQADGRHGGGHGGGGGRRLVAGRSGGRHRLAEVRRRRPRRAMGPFGRGGEQFWNSVERLQRRAPARSRMPWRLSWEWAPISAAWCG